jgi:hypothetical protein
MAQFADAFPESEIVATLTRQLTAKYWVGVRPVQAERHGHLRQDAPGEDSCDTAARVEPGSPTPSFCAERSGVAESSAV